MWTFSFESWTWMPREESDQSEDARKLFQHIPRNLLQQFDNGCNHWGKDEEASIQVSFNRDQSGKRINVWIHSAQEIQYDEELHEQYSFTTLAQVRTIVTKCKEEL